MNLDAANHLKRCSSAPIINTNLQTNKISSILAKPMNTTQNNTGTNSPASRSRDASPTPNIFTPRARRYSTSFSPLAVNPGPRLTPRVSQLRQEECADIASREVNHEREVHNALQISQSWEDLTLDAENWSFKTDNDLTNPLHVNLPLGISCSSPSPTSSRTGLRLPYGLSPSPTRRTFQTRRSMSPIAMRPSSLSGVKRKFELEDNSINSYSPPPFKRIFSDRGSSPCPSPLLTTCPSPDSTEGRTTPKFYISKLYTNNTNSSSSVSSSPSAAPSPCSSSAMEMQIDLPIINNITHSDYKIGSDIINTTTANNFADVKLAGNVLINQSANEHKIKQLLDGTEAALLIHARDPNEKGDHGDSDDKMAAETKTEYFSAVKKDAICATDADCGNDSGNVCSNTNANIENRVTIENISLKLNEQRNNDIVVSK